MYCNYCGQPNPDDASYCRSCGRSTGSTPQLRRDSSPKQETVIPSRKQPIDGLEDAIAEGQSRQVEEKPHESAIRDRAPDARTQLDGLLHKIRNQRASLFLAVGVLLFALFSTGAWGSRKDQKGGVSPAGMLVGSIIWVTYARRKLTRLQNERYSLEEALGNPGALQSGITRKTLLTILAVALGILSYGWGVFSEDQGEAGYAKELLAEAKRLNAENVQFRARFAEIYGRETPTFERYVQRCRDLEAVLSAAEPGLTRREGIMKELKALTRGKEARERLELMDRIQQLDRHVFALLRQEIERSKELARLPSHQQPAYFASYIEPIQRQQESLISEQMALVKEAQRRGVKLPEDITGAVAP